MEECYGYEVEPDGESIANPNEDQMMGSTRRVRFRMCDSHESQIPIHTLNDWGVGTYFEWENVQLKNNTSNSLVFWLNICGGRATNKLVYCI